MKELLDTAKAEQIWDLETDLLDQAYELKELGFSLLSKQILAKHYQYPKISQQKVVDFLCRKHATLFGLYQEEMLKYWKENCRSVDVEAYISEFTKSGKFPYGLDINLVPMDNNIRISVGRSFKPTDEEYEKYSISRGGYNGGSHILKTLNWHEHPIAVYGKLPPDNVIEKFKETKSRECFDRYVVADLSLVNTLIEVKDPLLLGVIEGSTDRYILVQWDDDIYVDDII